MTWFRVEDATENKIVLVQASNVKEACRVYMEQYPADLYVKEATSTEINRWLTDPWPWTTKPDQRGEHTHP